MKRKILVTAIITATLFIIMAVSASACRQLPCCAQDAVDSGSISLGETEITIEEDECKVYSFTPDKDGFYSLEYSSLDCSFLKTYEEDGCTYYGFYYYISTEKETDGEYFTTEFVNMKKGNTYKLFVANPDYYYDCESGEPVENLTDTVEIGYAGELTDFDIYDTDLTFRREMRYDEDSDSPREVIALDDIEEWDDGSSYIYTFFDAEFSGAGVYRECCLNENCCCIMPLEIIGSADFKEGTNTVKIELLGLQKDFEINCSFDAGNFIMSDYTVSDLFDNIRTGIRVMLGLEGIGSPMPELGAEIIRISIVRFFNSFLDTACYL